MQIFTNFINLGIKMGPQGFIYQIGDKNGHRLTKNKEKKKNYSSTMNRPIIPASA